MSDIESEHDESYPKELYSEICRQFAYTHMLELKRQKKRENYTFEVEKDNLDHNFLLTSPSSMNDDGGLCPFLEYAAGRTERHVIDNQWEREVFQLVSGNQCIRRMKMDPNLYTFPKLISKFWDNRASGVNDFIMLDNVESNPIWVPPNEIYRLTVDPLFENDGVDPRCYAFGFCFKGPNLTVDKFWRAAFIKEAYGSTHCGVHYVCIICFRDKGLSVIGALQAPYATGIIPSDIVALTVPGRNFHISAYKEGVQTDDPILRMIKTPSPHKWYWHRV